MRLASIMAGLVKQHFRYLGIINKYWYSGNWVYLQELRQTLPQYD
jgi:hypothetical protein